MIINKASYERGFAHANILKSNVIDLGFKNGKSAEVFGWDEAYYSPQGMLTLETTPLTKTTAAQNEDTLSYLRVRGLYYLAVVFVATIFFLSIR